MKNRMRESLANLMRSLCRMWARSRYERHFARFQSHNWQPRMTSASTHGANTDTSCKGCRGQKTKTRRQR